MRALDSSQTLRSIGYSFLLSLRVPAALMVSFLIAWYLASGEWRDKAGAYAIQGLASRFIPRIEGSYSNIVGLPVACIHELLAGIPSP